MRIIGDITPGPDPRADLAFGIASVGYARADDPLSRLALVESVLFDLRE
jgi:hypothetical protein